MCMSAYSYGHHEVLLCGSVVERILMDSDKVLDTFASWQLEQSGRVDAAEVVSFALLLKVTFRSTLNTKCINTVTFHYLQVCYFSLY
jgi:hypothetical protein